jgi:hypothetical protein
VEVEVEVEAEVEVWMWSWEGGGGCCCMHGVRLAVEARGREGSTGRDEGREVHQSVDGWVDENGENG